MAKKSLTIFELTDLQNPQEGDQFPVARPGIEDDNKLTIGKLIRFNPTTKILTLLNRYSFDVSSLMRYMLTVEASGEGSVEVIDPSEDNTYTYNEEKTIKATPNDGYTFVKWMDGEEEYGSTDPQITINMIDNHHFVGYFEEVTSHIISFDIEEGDSHGSAKIQILKDGAWETIEDSSTEIEDGGHYRINISPFEGYTYTEQGGYESNTEVIATEDKEYKITFTIKSYDVTAGVVGNKGGSVALTDTENNPISGKVNHFTEVLFKAFASEDYQFTGWFSNSQGTPPAVDNRTTFPKEIDNPISLYAKFERTGASDYYVGYFNNIGKTAFEAKSVNDLIQNENCGRGYIESANTKETYGKGTSRPSMNNDFIIYVLTKTGYNARLLASTGFGDELEDFTDTISTNHNFNGVSALPIDNTAYSILWYRFTSFDTVSQKIEIVLNPNSNN